MIQHVKRSELLIHGDNMNDFENHDVEETKQKSKMGLIKRSGHLGLTK